MKLARLSQSRIDLTLTETEYEGIAQSLNEVCNGFRVPSFEQRIGADENTVTHLLDLFHPRNREDLPPTAQPLDVTIVPAGDNQYRVKMTSREARIIANCLSATLDEIGPSEYQTRMGIGFSVDGAKRIVTELQSALNERS